MSTLNLNMSSPPSRRRNSAVRPPNSGGRLHPLNNPTMQQNLNNPLKIFQHGLSSFFSKFIFNNPLFSGHIFPPPAIAAEHNNSQNSWDSHGWPANLTIGLDRLNRFKKYKISAVQFLTLHSRTAVDGADESFGDMVGLHPGGVYTKQDLKDRLDFLSSSGNFEKIEFDVRTNPDGTIAVSIPFREAKFPSRSKFRCISVGLLPDDEKRIEVNPLLGDYHQLIELERAKYNKKIKKAKGCLLPRHVEDEIEDMLRKGYVLNSGTLMKISRMIQDWYHENQYDAAWVVGTFDRGREICFEVAEGDITEVNIRFRDKLGNFCEGNTDIGLIQRVLPKEVTRVYLDSKVVFYIKETIGNIVNLVYQFD